MVNNMESALDILSRAADMVGSARILKQALKKGSTSSQRKQTGVSNNDNGKRNTVVADAEPSPPLEEPLDMSIKSRKRHTPENSYNFVKKHRPSVIYFGRGEHTKGSSSSDEDIESSSSGTTGLVAIDDTNNAASWDPEEPEVAPRRVIITHDVNDDGGLEEHFRRSLSKDYSKDAEAQQGVDAHFSRSLGSAAWKEIQRVASIKKETPESSNPEAHNVKDNSASDPDPIPKPEPEEKLVENVDSVSP